jgi:hypothetical protein
MITSFQILGQTIEVIIDDEYCHKNKCYGQFIPFENKIILATKYKSKKVWLNYKQEIIDATFYHELMHCLLFYSNSNEWLNEELVDKLGNFMHQYEISKK